MTLSTWNSSSFGILLHCLRTEAYQNRFDYGGGFLRNTLPLFLRIYQTHIQGSKQRIVLSLNLHKILYLLIIYMLTYLSE